MFSELHDLHPCTCLICWASVRKMRRSLAPLFSLLGSTLWLCAQRSPLLGALQSQVHPLLVSTLRSLAVLHYLQLFPMGLQLSAVTPRSVLLVLQPSPQFSCESGSSETFLARVSGSYFALSQFPSASSSLSQCSLGSEALVSSRLCQVEFSSCFQYREIHLTHPWCR